MVFERLGVVLTLENKSFGDVVIGSEPSGLRDLVTVAISRLESSVSEQGFVFQTGERAQRSDFTIDAFRDIRLNGNTDAKFGLIFNQFGEKIDQLSLDGSDLLAEFQGLTNLIDNVLESVTRKRVSIGALENRLHHNIRHLDSYQFSVSSALSAIRDVDYVTETASFTRRQILQQAAMAMLAQANIQPSVVLSLLTEKPTIGASI